MSLLTELLQNPTSTQVRTQLTMGRCVLLDWAVSFQESGQPIGQNLFAKTDDQTGFNIADLKPVLLPIGYRQLQSRYSLIDAFLNNDEDLGSAINEVVSATSQAWDYQPSPAVKPDVASEPSFLQSLQTDPKLISHLRHAAENNGGWSHPGILLAGETLAALNGDTRSTEASARTKILFAFEHMHRPYGILAEVSIEGIPQGAGLLVPNAYSCGYLWMNRSFSNGLQNALWAARNHAKQHFGDECSFDWRWTIDLRAATDRVPDLKGEPQIELEGHSAEVALACAMIASHPANPDRVRSQDPLDPHVGVTARIGDPGNETHDEIAGVSSVDVKTLVGPMERRRLWEVVIAKSQVSSQIPWDDQRFRFPVAETLQEAYELTVRNRRITTGVNRFLALEAGKLKRELCQPYIMPAIAERTRQSESAEQGRHSETPLSEEAIEHLLNGRLYAEGTGVPPEVQHPWVGSRVRIFADSGLGKSVFILHLQRQIARSNQDLLPIRMGRVTGEDSDLSEIDWTIGREEILGQLAGSRGLTEAIDRWCRWQGREQLDAEERDRWFSWMIRTGRVVFLFDALDQTARRLLGLGKFLAFPEIKTCPAILTGRPSSENSRAFRDNAWRTLKLLPFDAERQRRYLGADLSRTLMLRAEMMFGIHSQHDVVKRRRIGQWKGLLNTPLLLALMKQIAIDAAGQPLHEIYSRKDLYDRAISHLIEKGLKLHQDSSRHLLLSESKVRLWLGRIAWRMIRRPDRHDFTGTIDGDDLERLIATKDFDSDSLTELERINITTAHQVVEAVGVAGLAFRHRSFLEYFAAWYLVSGETDVSDDLEEVNRDFVSPTAREKVLREIHAVVDDGGNWLPHMLDAETSDRPAQWSETLQFMLAHATGPKRDQLALQLVELGNPWIVFMSIVYGGIEFSSDVTNLVAYLARQIFESRNRFDPLPRDSKFLLPYEGIRAADAKRSMNAILKTRSDFLEKTIDVPTRDSRYLHSLRMCSKQDLRVKGMARIHERTIDAFLEEHRWVPVLGHEHLALSDFPVTNVQFEAFCPTIRRRSGQNGGQEELPVVYVTWHMANEFCEWLNSCDPNHRYFLPEFQVLKAAWRWGDWTEKREWFKADWEPDRGGWIEEKLVAYDYTDGTFARRSRQAAIDVLESSETKHPTWQSAQRPGLIDLIGNIREWCGGSPYGPNGQLSRVVGDPGNPAGYMELWHHTMFDVGFRVCRTATA